VLLFSQFTAMLDLIKPELATAEIDHVELTGATRDRADPISRFQSGGRGCRLSSHRPSAWEPRMSESRVARRN
jgi:SNF2 family DNA or RNA helicase